MEVRFAWNRRSSAGFLPLNLDHEPKKPFVWWIDKPEYFHC